jgi:hypothetical protein
LTLVTTPEELLAEEELLAVAPPLPEEVPSARTELTKTVEEPVVAEARAHVVPSLAPSKSVAEGAALGVAVGASVEAEPGVDEADGVAVGDDDGAGVEVGPGFPVALGVEVGLGFPVALGLELGRGVALWDAELVNDARLAEPLPEELLVALVVEELAALLVLPIASVVMGFVATRVKSA